MIFSRFSKSPMGVPCSSASETTVTAMSVAHLQRLASIGIDPRTTTTLCFVPRAEYVVTRAPKTVYSEPPSGRVSHPCDPNDQLQSVSCNLVPFATLARPIRLNRYRRASQRARHPPSPLIDQVCATHISFERVEVKSCADTIAAIRQRPL
jgi:hypothetical protein